MSVSQEHNQYQVVPRLSGFILIKTVISIDSHIITIRAIFVLKISQT